LGASRYKQNLYQAPQWTVSKLKPGFRNRSRWRFTISSIQVRTRGQVSSWLMYVTRDITGQLKMGQEQIWPSFLQIPEIIKTKRRIRGRMESPASLSDAVCVSTAKPPRLRASSCILVVTQAQIVATSEIFSGRPFSRPPTSSAKQGELGPEVRV